MEAFWGNKILILSFAGIDFRINGLDAAQCHALSKLYAPSQAYECRESDALDTWVSQRTFPERDAKYYTNRDNIYTPLIRRCEQSIEIEGFRFQAAIDFTPRLQGILCASDGKLLATPMVFENYLRIFAAYAILMRGGLLLHSSGIVVDGNAYLFLGRSGAGKTTISRLALAAGAKILSDDINIVVPAPEGGFTVGAVPFAGELGYESLEQTGCYPLKGLYWLEKAPLLGCGTIAATGQVAKLLACCPVVNTDAHQLDRILGTGASLLKNTPMHLLRFRRDEAFVAILKIMRGQ